VTPADAGESDAALVARVRAGETEAYDTLVRRHIRGAYTVARRLLGNKEDAEDLVQDAFIQALDRLDSFDETRPFAPWFYRVLTNRGLNARKSIKLRTTAELDDEVMAGGESPAQSAERAELRETLAAAVGTLPERQQTIVQLAEIDGWTSGEIAQALGMADGTVRWHLHEARKALRAALEPLRPEERA
jgi:RNA polymerase sigma-70 factor (ECF subfamily)